MERRDFLKLVMLGALCPMVGKGAMIEHDENLVAIFSDTHVGVHDDGLRRSGLERCVSEVLSLRPLPSKLLVLGDVAYRDGLHGDYEIARDLLLPMRSAGISCHFCMGNHDCRQHFMDVFQDHAASLVSGKLVSLVETPRADFLLLDSLVEGKWAGALGRRQEAWLETFLRGRRKKVFLCSHHSVLELRIERLVARHSCVAGYLNGHHHHWYPLLNFHGIRSWVLPSTGHWGDLGFAMMRLEHKRAVLDLHLHDVRIQGQVTEQKELDRRNRLHSLRTGVRRAVFPL